MSTLYKSTYIRLRWPIFDLLVTTAAVLLLTSYIWTFFVTAHTADFFHLWETNPIVSIYIPSSYEGNYCAEGFQPAAIKSDFNSVGKGPCACVENNLGLKSSNNSCAYAEETSEKCMSLPEFAPHASDVWRETTICIKRAGRSALNRPHPDVNGKCPAGFRKCGKGLTQQEGAICFPSSTECPIVNMMMLPSAHTVPAHEGWESAGAFTRTNSTLYVRREHLNELPIVDLNFQLTEYNSKGKNLRGHCYNKANQVTKNEHTLPSYDIKLPKKCTTVDTRYVLVDQVPLQVHFLQNLQLTEPACAGFALYPLSDPRYQPALDPDYLNSGVKCDFTSKYKCVRDPYHRTNCAPGDGICDSVVNQNICGAYAHAVRSAFQDYSHITLGMYLAHEIQWTDGCAVGKEAIYTFKRYYLFYSTICFVVFLFWVLYNCGQNNPEFRLIRFVHDYKCYVVIIAVGVIQVLILAQGATLYYAVARGNCTDTFTQQVLLPQLEPVVTSFYTAVAALFIMVVLTVESFILSHLTLRHNFAVKRFVDPQREAKGGPGKEQYELAPIGSHPKPYLYHRQTNLTEIFPSTPPPPCVPCCLPCHAATATRTHCSIFVWGGGEANMTDENRATVAAANAAAAAAVAIDDAAQTTAVGEETSLLSAASTYDSIL